MNTPIRLRPWSLLAFTLALILASPAEAACAGQRWLTLEVVAGELAGDGLAEFVEVDSEGCVLSFYAEFDRRAGLYQRQLVPAEQQALAADVESSRLREFDAGAQRARLQWRARQAGAKGQAELFHVADADQVRLRINDATGSHLIEFPSPELYADLVKDDEALQQLAAFVRGLRALGADQRRLPIAGERP